MTHISRFFFLSSAKEILTIAKAMLKISFFYKEKIIQLIHTTKNN